MPTFSLPQALLTALVLAAAPVPGQTPAPLASMTGAGNQATAESSGSLAHLVQQSPASVTRVTPDTVLVDFGKVAFGNLRFTPPAAGSKEGRRVTVRFGEAMKNGRIDRTPPGSVRFSEVEVTLDGTSQVIAPPPDPRNTAQPRLGSPQPPAVLTPASWGVVTPFRWVEIEGWPGRLDAAQIHRQAAFDRSWSDDAATFHSSDPMLNRIWELSHDSIKATTFAGIFVDGDRERIPYEADAYLNQLGYYAGNPDVALPRATFEWLMVHPTWPSEWGPHMVFIAYADWMQTGDRAWLAANYEFLKTKQLRDRVGSDGLVASSARQIEKGDLVDWPQGERDGYVFTRENTVVNAFRLRALQKMALLAAVLGKANEAAAFKSEEAKGLAAFQHAFFDPARHLYRDGVGTDHASLHANLFSLAFGLVPAQDRAAVAQWIAGRGMAASVYAAQYLLEGLFENGQDAAALHLIAAEGDRSWRHMVDAETTITWEAWDQRYKPNQDWNHSWGAAPANLFPRYLLGVQAAAPGWQEVAVEPHPGELSHAEGKVPTPRGPVTVSWTQSTQFHLNLSLPKGMTANVRLPAKPQSRGVLLGGKPVRAHRDGAWWVLDAPVSGSASLKAR